MRYITELKPTNLIAVEVAPDATNYRFGHKVFGELVWDKDLCYDTECNVWKVGNAILPELKYRIFGEVTKDKIFFDVEPYVKSVPLSPKLWNNYNTLIPLYENMCKTKEESFYSLLTYNGLYFENPIGRYKPSRMAESDGGVTTLDWDRNTWQSFEDKLIKGKLLILNIK